MVDDHQLVKDDYYTLKEKYSKCERDREEERSLLNQKLNTLEDQYKTLQKNSLDKEESLQLEFVQKENDLVVETTKAQQYADKMSSEAATRERQLKKI